MPNQSKKILTEISIGELLDKLSIIEIKLNKIKNHENRKHILKEFKVLEKTRGNSIKMTKQITFLYKKIKTVNLKLWKIEDKIRSHEKNKKYNKTFIKLARDVYLTNDIRGKIKNKINRITGSNLIEVKKYTNY